MKYVRQMCLILLISFVGEILHALIPLPVPGGIYGLVLLFILLLTGAIKLSAVKETGKFLIEIMPIMFIPAAVGLIESYKDLLPVCGQVVLITIVSTVLVMGASGLTTQFVMRKKKGGKEHE